MKTHLRGEGRRGTWDEKGLGQAGPSEQGWVQRSCLINSKPTDGHRASVSDDEQVLEMAVVIQPFLYSVNVFFFIMKNFKIEKYRE